MKNMLYWQKMPKILKVKARSYVSCISIISISLFVNACSSSQDIALADSVITALPQEVQGCTFLGDVIANPRYRIENARFDLKLQAAKLNATHLVETIAVPLPINQFTLEYGVGMSGRAYNCPQGLGPKIETEQAKKQMQGDIPHPHVNVIN